MRDRICVIIVNSNGKQDTLECLESLATINYTLFTPIVIDNGSSDDSVNFIREAYPRTPIFESEENIGMAASYNIGIQWALRKPFKWILLLSNKTIASPDLLSAFINTAKEYADAKIFGASVHKNFDSTHLEPNSAVVDFVPGEGLFFDRIVAETIGVLDPRFPLYWHDKDYCYRARRKGFLVRTAPLAKIWIKEQAPIDDYYWWRGKLLWHQRNVPKPENKHWKELLYLVRRRKLNALLGVLHFYLRIFSSKK